MDKIEFNVETQRILKLLANDIYNSPYALLRENVQNAFDAVLMRRKKEPFTPKVDIAINNGQIVISDNGIGMTYDVIDANFWKPGASGKNNSEARAAGVVGTFGIGAMANFGICTSLEIISRYYQGEKTLKSRADRDRLEIGKKCIDIEETSVRTEPGTTVVATLEEGVHVDLDEAKNYLQQFVKHLDIPITLNGKIISQQPYFNKDTFNNDECLLKTVSREGYTFDMDLYISKVNDGRVAFYIHNIKIIDNPIKGDIFLVQNVGTPIQGLRNGFGLASLPISTFFNLGGVANLPFLIPTAGRDSISVESVDKASKIISIVEEYGANLLSERDICDKNKSFLNFVYRRGQYNLANNILIMKAGGNEFYKLGALQPEMEGKKVYYYSGNDLGIIGQYSGENTILLMMSKDYPRRNIQQQMLNRKGITPVKDNATVLEIYERMSLNTSEMAFLLRIMSTLKDDYLITDPKPVFARISHGVTNLVKKEGDMVYVYISRDSNNVKQVLKIYDMDPMLFDGFVKDYIRNYLYQQIAQYVPSSTREGADELYRMLQRNKELYTIEKYERGAMEGLMEDYIQGKIKLEEVIRVSDDMQKIHHQTVSHQQVGDMEAEIPSITKTNTVDENTPQQDPGLAIPPIKVLNNNTKMKILKTSQPYPQLHNYTHFLALSDRVFNRQMDFFLDPHTTRVMWGMHKIVYIFTHASGTLTLYYEIELKHQLPNGSTGGITLPTTTVISKNRIFVPIIPQLVPYFDLKEDKLEFYVRFDLITDFEESRKDDE